MEFKIIIIDGNIGAGKSKIVEYLKNYFKNYENVYFIDEPLNEWLNIKDENGKNILDLFYESTSSTPSEVIKNSNINYGFLFQLTALITRIGKILDVKKNNKTIKVVIIERSILSDKEIFKRNLLENNNISYIENILYELYFNKFYPLFKETMFYFLDCSPEECLNRIIKRNRIEESNIPLDYLQTCDRYYKDMFNKVDCNKKLINTETEFENYILDVIKDIETYL